MVDMITFPNPFTPGFMGFETEQEFMLDFMATMRDSGLKRYARTYAELLATQNRPLAQPTSFVPTIVTPREGGDDIVINGEVRSATAMRDSSRRKSNGTYEGPKDLNYSRDLVEGTMIVKSEPKVNHEKKFGKAPGTRSGRGFVHAMSPAQRNYVLSLLRTKDTSELATRMVRGWTLDPKEIDSISKQHARPFIDALLSCPNKSATTIKGTHSDEKEISGSPRQIEWLTKGLNGKPALLTEKGFTTEADIKEFSQKYNYAAKQMIDALLNMKTKPLTSVKEMTSNSELSEGIYSNGTKVFKVYVSQDGSRLFAKELVEESHTESVKVRKGSTERKEVTFTHAWEYKGMAHRFITSTYKRVSDSEAASYGQISGTCCRCGRRLVDETSVSNGIGPECAKK